MASRARSLDEINLKVIRLLLQNGRMSVKDIAERIHLSPTPCLRRVGMLEREGVIERYKAVVDPGKLGYSIHAYLSIKRLRESDLNTLSAQLLEIQEILACHVVSGEYDLIAEVVAINMEHYASVILDRISRIPGVHDLRSTFAIRTLKRDGTVPV